MLDSLIEKYSLKLSTSNPNYVVSIATFVVVTSSVPLVYFLSMLFGAEYTSTIFVLSILSPLLMVPPTIIIIVKLSKHLKHFQDELGKEIEVNKKKDIMLFEQERFALMGEMMANISHQWKQPLNTINLAILSSKFSDNKASELEKNFDIIESNVCYLASTIDDFMSFFDKKTNKEIRPLDEIITEIKSIIQAQMDTLKIKFNIKIENEFGNIKLLSSISQVILNLLGNAKDASTESNQEKEICLKFTALKKSLRISCCDNGEGIPYEIKDKIFNPYFTTKHKTQGTGIGLYMSKQIINKIFEGDIKIDISKGTCFIVDIPYSEKCILEKDKSIND